jgi:hypothetical protein
MYGSRDRSVFIAKGYGLDGRVFSPVGAKKVSLPSSVQTGSGVHPSSYPIDIRGFFPGVKRQGREADHPPLFNAEVKKGLHDMVLN